MKNRHKYDAIKILNEREKNLPVLSPLVFFSAKKLLHDL